MNSKVIILLAIGALYLFLCPLQSQAREQTVADISAGVIVAGRFSLSLDKNVIDFGFIRTGEEKILGEGEFYNQITCESNEGKSWFLKIHTPRPPQLLGKHGNISIENFKWMVVDADGEGELINRYKFNQFDIKPSLVYTSAGRDNFGEDVKVRFRYGLFAPRDSLAGTYQTTVVFTMSEVP